MGKIQNIAVFYGSDSSECEVSCRSGEYTASRIDDTRYNIYEVYARFGRWELVAFRRKDSMRVALPEGARPLVDRNDFSVNVYGEKVKLDYVYVMQHGKPGENGLLQGYLEMLGIPYSSCSSFVSTIAFDKYSCKSYLRDADFVKLAPDAFVRKGDDVDAFAARAVAKLGLPLFVKPTDGGSSFGISRVTEAAALADAVNYAFTEGDSVIVEKSVPGREFTCAVYRDGVSSKASPVIEIVSENDYFDYDAKYNGHSQELCPAPIDDSLRDEIQKTSCRIYDYLGCKGIVRIDYISSEDGLYFLEVNTIPGMTSASLVPKMVRAAGMDMTAFLTGIIENS